MLISNYKDLLNSVPLEIMGGEGCGDVVMGIDPGLGSGFKYAFIVGRKVAWDGVVGEVGRFCGVTEFWGTVRFLGKKGGEMEGAAEEMRRIVRRVGEKYKLGVLNVPIGTGTGYFEVREFLAKSLKGIVEVNFIETAEHGASAYSALTVDEDMKDIDVPVRGAVSIGRRRVSPMAEFLKLPVVNAGVGM